MGSPDLLAAALDYSAKGVAVFPCHPETKRPLIARGFKDASADPATIRAWWERWPTAMIGAPTGSSLGAWVLDVDDADAFEAARERLGLKLPETRRCITGKGFHLHFRFDPDCPVRNAQCRGDKDTGAKVWPFKQLPGAEVRGEGGYVILPPSIHPSGRRYEWSPDGQPVDAPAALLRFVLKADEDSVPAIVRETPRIVSGDTAYGLRALDDECGNIASAPNGSQEKTLNDAALKIGALVAGGSITRATAKRSLIAAGLAMPSYNHRDPWTPAAIEAKVERGLTDGEARPRYPQERAIRRSPPDDVSFDPETGEVLEMAPRKLPAAFDVAPVDLWACYEAPSLPLGVLPAVIERFAVQHGEVMGVAPVGLAMAALTVCAAAISDEIALQVKAHDRNWRESARLWTGMIGPPSTKKSPIMREAMRPLVRIDRNLMAAFMLEKEKYDALPPKEQKTTRRPRTRRHVVSDATIESLQEVLRNSPGGVISEQDELSGWFGAMDKYTPGKGAAADRAFWLKAYNGGPASVDRIARGSTHIPNLSISLLGGVQPDVIRKLANETIDDGLVQRLIPVILPPAQVGKDAPTGEAVTNYERLIERLVLLGPPRRSGIPNLDEGRPDPLTFSPEARQVRERMEREHAELIGALEEVSPKLASHFGKHDGLFARLCVIWHCIENCEQGPVPPGEISHLVAERVARFMAEYLRPSAIAFYAGMLGLSDGHETLRGLASYIVAERLDEVNARVVQRSTRTLRSFTADEARHLCERLEAFGWLDPIDPPARSNTPRWRVNPAVHELYAEKGRQDAERRKAAREALRYALAA